MVRNTFKWWSGALVFGVLLVGIPTLLTPADAIRTTSPEGQFALGLLQLVALVIPALAIFTDALLQLSYKRAERPGKSGGLGRFQAEEFRGGVLLIAGVSSLLLSMGVVSLLGAIQLPEGATIGVGLILLGVSFIPALVLFVALLAFLETRS